MNTEDFVAADNLRKILDSRKKEWGWTQEDVANRLGMTRQGVSNYANGRIPIREGFLLRVSKVLGVEPRTIRPDFEFTTRVDISDLTGPALEIAKAYQALSPERKKAVEQIIRAMLPGNDNAGEVKTTMQ